MRKNDWRKAIGLLLIAITVSSCGRRRKNLKLRITEWIGGNSQTGYELEYTIKE